MAPERALPRWGALLVLALVMAALPGPHAVDAQEPPTSRLVLTQFTPIIGPGARDGEGIDNLSMRVLLYADDDRALTDVDLVVETFRRVTSRSALHQALRGAPEGARELVERIPLIGETPVEPGYVPGAELDLATDRIARGGAGGIYPVQLSLVQGTTVLDQIATAAIHLDEIPANPLRAAMVWPIASAPSPTLDGTIGETTLAELRPGGRLATLLSAAEAGDAKGLVLDVPPHLLAALEKSVERAALAGDGTAAADSGARAANAAATADVELMATTLERLRALIATAPLVPVSGPRADADLSALVEPDRGLGELAGRLATGGREDLTELTGRSPEPTSFLAVAPLSPAALDLLPGQHLLVPYDHLDGPDPRLEPDLPPATRSVRGASGRELVVTVADPYVMTRLGAPDLTHGPIAGVQDLLVETAMVYFERPGIADRPLLMLPPRDWAPADGFAHRLATLLPRSPWLRLTDADRLAELPTGAEATVRAAPPVLPAATASAIAATLAQVDTATDALVDGATRINATPTTSLLEAVGRASSAAWADRPELADNLLRQVTTHIDSAYGTIDVPTGSGITLTAEEVPLPVTIRRNGGEALNVEIEVVSRGSLEFPNGSVQRLVLDPDASQTVSFTARSRSRGTLPVTVIVRSQDGALEFTRASMTVNSQVVSRPALVAVAVVVIALLLLGRRRRRPEPPSGDLVVVAGGGDDRPEPSPTGPGRTPDPDASGRAGHER